MHLDQILPAPQETSFDVGHRNIVTAVAHPLGDSKLRHFWTRQGESTPLYVRPVQTRFGVRSPEVSTVLEAVQKETSKAIAPSGAATENQLGLTTQVPLRPLDHAGYAANAIADRALATTVARHKNSFFRERDGGGAHIDYAVAVGGGLQLVPEGDRLTLLAGDYERMVADGLLFSTSPLFSLLIDLCRDIQGRANAAAR